MLLRGFKALKQIVKLQYQLGNTEDMLTAYKCASVRPGWRPHVSSSMVLPHAASAGGQTLCCRQLLDYTKSAVTRNKSEKKINSLLDYVSASPNMQLLQDFYATTLSALQASRPCKICSNRQRACPAVRLGQEHIVS